MVDTKIIEACVRNFVPKNTPLVAGRLRALLHYDPQSGVFTWRMNRKGGPRAGDVAGNATDGYREISVDGRTYKAHRLAWLYMVGEWPAGPIDHRNGVGSDNTWSNLRAASHAINNQNLRGPKKNGTSGFLGVCWDKRRRRWVASITVNSRNKFLGYHETAEAAHANYVAAKRMLHEGCTI